MPQNLIESNTALAHAQKINFKCSTATSSERHFLSNLLNLGILSSNTSLNHRNHWFKVSQFGPSNHKDRL